MVTFEVKDVKLRNGSLTTSYAQFNNGHSHLLIDDSCWVIGNEGEDKKIGYSAWIFSEAAEILKGLPNKPSDYKPYKERIERS